MTKPAPDQVHSAVREHYGAIARSQQSSDACCSSGCCDSLYPASQVADLPASVTDLSLGCGDPVTVADIRPGDTVIDLGAGGGIDCFLAARRTGPSGRVIGVDMTDDMLAQARANAARLNAANVEFRQGQIEALPVEDASADVILSNCVINLSPDKPRVFAEAFRVLKPGGRLAVSDIVAFADLPDAVRKDLALYTGCIAGASPVTEVERMLGQAGFTDIRVAPKDESRTFIREWAPGTPVADYVVSASIEGRKPRT
jgi:arsenite methyltransferase